MKDLISRRTALKGSMIGMIGLSLPTVSNAGSFFTSENTAGSKPYFAYPALDPALVKEVVGKSHFDLDTVKKIVEKRPELARVSWDWGFGDFESAVGAASHVGRRDIVQYLIGKGARPTIFTYAVLGANEIVQSMIKFSPGIQTTFGPHGISLLSHARAGLRMEKSMSATEVDNSKKLIEYLESLGDAGGEQYLEVSEEEKSKYLGDYMYGEEKNEGFTVQLNMRKMLSLGAIGEFGGALLKTGENEFIYNGAPSVKVSFQSDEDGVKSVTITEPENTLVARKV